MPLTKTENDLFVPDFIMPEHRGGDGWTILHGDALDIIPHFQPGAFDAVITDPPYAGGGAKPPAGYVCILSIHRSKGLEFPVCIVADLARQFNKKELYTAPVLRHTRLGVGLCLRAESGARYPTAPQRAIRQALMREQLSEEMRVLYVALTRAKDRLLLFTAAKDPAAMLSKLAVSLLGLARVLAKEGGKHGVRANVVCPGFVRTPLVEKQIPEQAQNLGISEEDVVKKVMLGQTVDGVFTTVQDVAETVKFLCEFPSNALTGQSIVVSHGWYMQ